jgi:hypothetical protein
LSYKPTIATTAEGGTGLNTSGATGNLLTSNGTAWVSAAPQASGGVGSASNLFPNTLFGFQGNYTLTTSPGEFAEQLLTVNATTAENPNFIQRFVSGPYSQTGFPGGEWDFLTYADINNTGGTNTLKYVIKRRAELTGMTGTYTGAGPTRTFTVTGGTPFIAGDANASKALASEVETPTQTSWITTFLNGSTVTVTLTDPAFVNVAGVPLNAIYYFGFEADSPDINSAAVTLYTTSSTQPDFPGFVTTDRIVYEYYAVTSANRTYNVYIGGSVHYSYFKLPISPTVFITGNTGTQVKPDVNRNLNILGAGNITTDGSLSTLTLALTGITNHAIQLGSATNTLTQLAPSATAGQILRSGGPSADPSFSTATYPATAGTLNNVLTSDGTNWISSPAGGGGGLGLTYNWNCVAGNPIDGTTYYLAPGTALTAITSTSWGSRWYAPVNCTLSTVYGSYQVAGTLGSAENVTIAIRLNDTSNTNVTTTLQLTATTGTFNNTGLSLAITAGSFLDFIFIGPTWATNPTNVRVAATIYLT